MNDIDKYKEDIQRQKENIQRKKDLYEIEKVYNIMRENENWGHVTLRFEGGKLVQVKQEVIVKMVIVG